MAEKVQVIIDAKDNASGVLRGLTASLGGFGSMIEQVTGQSVNWGNVAAQATEFVMQQMKEAYKVATEYAASVRDLSLASGTSAEESSRLLQVLDDFEISAEGVTAATKAMTKQGLAPTIETIAKLSDEYLTLTTAQEKNKFITENLGRGGAQWANVLKEGSAAILEMNDSVSANLILNDEQIRQYEELRLNQDEFNDNIQEVQMSFANTTLPFFNMLLDDTGKNMIALGLEMGLTAKQADSFAITIGAMERQTNSTVQSYTAWAQSAYAVAEAQAVAAKAAADAEPDYKKLLDMTLKLNDASKDQINQLAYSDLYKRLADDADGLTEAERTMLNEVGIQLGIFDEKAVVSADKVDGLNQQFVDGQIDVANYIAAIQQIYDAVQNIPDLPPLTSGDLSPDSNGGNGYASGTNGWMTVPPGFSNDTYPIRLSSGEKFSVIPSGKSEGGGGSNYFYGNTTFVVSGDGSDFMDNR